MKQGCKIWNTLHDGQIIKIQGKTPGNLKLTIEIEYLAERLKGSFSSIILKLIECQHFTYSFYKSKDETIIYSDIEKITEDDIAIILSCETKDNKLYIYCACGLIVCTYENCELYLLDNTLINYQDLNKACTEYWDEWENNKV